MRDFFEGKNDFDFSRQLDIHILYFACSLCGELEYTNFSFWQKYKVKKAVFNTPCFKDAMRSFKLPNVSVKFKIVLWLMKHRLAFLLSLI